MDVSNPASSVIPSMEGAVLMVLAGSTGTWSLAEVHEQVSHASKNGVRHALLRLVDGGVVHAVPGGYCLNREHLAAPAVLMLAGLRLELLRRIGELSDGWETAPRLLGVFGSFARRDGDAESDIDVLLVTESTAADEQAGEVSERVRAWTGNECHVIALTPSDINRMRRNKERILAEWDRDLIEVRGDSAILKGRR